MKKTLAFLLTLVLMLSLCACDSTAGSNETASTQEEATTPVETEPAETEPVESKPEEIEAQTNTATENESIQSEEKVSEEVFYAVGDTVSSDRAELVFTSYGVSPMYRNIIAESDGCFIIVNFTLKNIGKTDFGFVKSAGNSTRSKYFSVIPTVDYNDGYIFCCGDTTLHGKNYDDSCFRDSDVEFIDDLKPLGKTATAEVAIYVPLVVIEDEDSPLLIKMSIPSSAGEDETDTFTFKIR